MTKINKSSLKFPGTLRKYSSGSKLNMFVEYTMVEEEKFSDTFGFTDEEVDEIFSYIEHNVDDVRDDVALMVSGESVPAKVREYAAVSMNLTARDYYRVEREDKSGTGFVDFIFYPNNQSEYPGMILELKVDASPEEAIQQIKEKQYDLKLRGRLGEDKENKILAVGISYDKKSKNHKCRVENL